MGEMLLTLWRLHFDWIFFILAGNKGNHKSLDEFEFQSDSIYDCRVSCPLVSEKSTYKLVSTLVPSFLIGSSSFLQVTRITIKAWMNLNFSLIPPLTAELAALECLKNQHIILLALCCYHFDWIFFIHAGNQDYHKDWDEFTFRPDRTSDSGVSCP